MLKRWICWTGAWLLCTIFGLPPANAHDLPLDRMMNAFVKVEPRQVDFVVRVPLDLLRGAPFPLAGDHYKIEASRAAVEAALKALASTLQLWEDNVRLVPSSAAGHLAPLADRSFEDYDRAVAQVAEPLAPDTVIAYNLAPVGHWFPPFIEAAIAASIFYMAIENIIGANLSQRWIITGLFGLVHGFGFADVLKEQLQFAGSHLLVSLLSFNVGIEIGQLAILCVFVPALALLLRGRMGGHMGIIVLSAIVANVAWQWMMQRGEVLWQTPWPQLTSSAAMTLARWVVALSLAVGAAKLLAKWIERKWPRLGRA